MPPHLQHIWPCIYGCGVAPPASVRASRLKHQSVPTTPCHTKQKFTKANIDRAVPRVFVYGAHLSFTTPTPTATSYIRLHGDFLVAGWANGTPRCRTHCDLHFHDRKSTTVALRSWARIPFCHASRRSAHPSHALCQCAPSLTWQALIRLGPVTSCNATS